MNFGALCCAVVIYLFYAINLSCTTDQAVFQNTYLRRREVCKETTGSPLNFSRFKLLRCLYRVEIHRVRERHYIMNKLWFYKRLNASPNHFGGIIRNRHTFGSEAYPVSPMDTWSKATGA